ncbi:MAG: methyltransferase domain-containing protein [Thermoplasmata archaeon]
MVAELRPGRAGPARPVQSDHLELVRTSGPLPLGYVQENSLIWLVARESTALWPTQVLREGRAQLRVDDHLVSGTVELITDPEERSQVLERFRAKYGERRFERHYAHPARVFRVDIRPSGPPDNKEVTYRRWLVGEFDNLADDYDRHITENRVNRLLRERSLAELRRVFSSAHYLLDVGCGSGMETLPLLTDGHEIVCVDISERMLEVVRKKARAAGLSESLRTIRASAAELAEVRKVISGPFDGAYSTYGALNCEEDIGAVPPVLFDLMAPRAPLIAGVYNRWCLFEMLAYGITGRWSRVFGRVQTPVPAGTSRFSVDAFAYSVAEFRAEFHRWFEAERVLGVPVIIPTSDMVVYADRFARRWEVLANIDLALGRNWPWKLLGDHFLLTSFRRAAPLS